MSVGFFGNARIHSILRWPLSFMWEIHWRWFGRPGWMTCKNNPKVQVATNRFLRGLQTDVARAGLLCGCNLTTLKQKYERTLCLCFSKRWIQLVNNNTPRSEDETLTQLCSSVGDSGLQCACFFFWLAQNYGRKRWTALTRICNTYISTVRVEYQKQLTYVPSKEVGIRWYQSFCATLLWDLGYQSLNTYPHQLYMYRAHLYRVTDVDYFLYMKEKTWSISSNFMWNHVTFSKVCGKAAGDEAEDEADDMEAPLIGKRLGGPWVGFNADFFTDNFRGFLWATAYTVLRKMTSNHRTFYTTFPREHLFLSKKKLGIWPWDKNWLLWSWHVFTAKKHNS